MRKFRVTVIFDVELTAESETQAEELAGEMALPDNYIIDSFDVDKIREITSNDV